VLLFLFIQQIGLVLGWLLNTLMLVVKITSLALQAFMNRGENKETSISEAICLKRMPP
jgi:hypothetical protein